MRKRLWHVPFDERMTGPSCRVRRNNARHRKTRLALCNGKCRTRQSHRRAADVECAGGGTAVSPQVAWPEFLERCRLFHNDDSDALSKRSAPGVEGEDRERSGVGRQRGTAGCLGNADLTFRFRTTLRTGLIDDLQRWPRYRPSGSGLPCKSLREGGPKAVRSPLVRRHLDERPVLESIVVEGSVPTPRQVV